MPVFSSLRKQAIADHLEKWADKNKKRIVQNAIKYAPIAVGAIDLIRNGPDLTNIGTLILSVLSFIIDLIDQDDVEIIGTIWQLTLDSFNWLKTACLRMLVKIRLQRPTVMEHQTQGDEMDKEDDFKFTFDLKSAAKIATALITLILSLFDRTAAFTNRATKAMANAAKTSSTTQELWTDVKQFFGIVPKEQKEIVQQIEDTSKSADDFIKMSTPQAYDKLDAITELRQQMERNVTEANGIFKNDKKGQSLTRIYAKRAESLLKLEDSLSKIREDLKAQRPAPACRHIFGPRGHGKSQFINDRLIPDVVEIMNWSPQDAVWTLSPSVKYFPHCVGQKIALCDEFLALRDEDQIIPYFNGLSTGQKMQVDGASVDTKHQTPNHYLFLTVSNFAQYEPQKNSSHAGTFADAVNSRLDRYYVHYPAYDPKLPRTEQNDKDLEPGNHRDLCIHKVRGDLTPWQNAVDSVESQCPDAHNGHSRTKIDYADFLKDIICDVKRSEKDHAYRTERLLGTITHQARDRVPVFLFHGDTGTGKSTIVDDLRARLEQQGHSCGENFADLVTVLDDVLPEDDLAYNDHFNRKKEGIIIACANLRYAKLPGVRRFPELHSRTVSRLPLKGRILTSDGKLLRSDNPGREVIVRKYGECYDHHGRSIDPDEIYLDMMRCLPDQEEKFYITRVGELPGKFPHHLHVKFRHFKDEEPEVIGTIPSELKSISFAKSMISLVRTMSRDPRDIHGLIKLAYSIFTSRTPKISVLITFADPACNFMIHDRRIYASHSYDFGPNDIQNAITGEVFRGNPIMTTLLDIEIGHLPETTSMEQALTTFYEDGWTSFFTGKLGKAISSVAFIMLCCLGSAAIVTLLVKHCTGYDKKKAKKIMANGWQQGFRAGKDETWADIFCYIKENSPDAMELMDRLTKFHQSNDNEKGEYKGERKRAIRAAEREAQRAEDAKFERCFGNDEYDYGYHQTAVVDALADTIMATKAGDQVEACMDKVTRNLVQVKRENMSCWGIMTHERNGITNSHLLRGGKDLTVITPQGAFRALVIRDIPEDDLAFFKIDDPKAGSFKDIRSCFVKEMDIDRATTAMMVVPGYDKKGEYYKYDRHHALCHTDLSGRENGHFQMMRKNYIVLRFPGDRALTLKGYCGLPYIITDIHAGVSLIAGLHSVAFTSGREIWGAAITQERLLQVPRHQAQFLKPVELGGETYYAHPKMEPVLKTLVPDEDVFKKNDRIEHLGHDRALHMGHASGATYTRLPNPIERPPTKIPALIPMRDIPKETVDRLKRDPQGKPCRGYEQLKKMEIVEQNFPPELVNHFNQEYFPYLDSFFQEGNCVRVLTNWEVVNGVTKPPLDKIHGFDMSKSMGFTMKKLTGSSKKRSIFKQRLDGQYEFDWESKGTQELFEIISDIEENPERTFFLPATATMKDELLPRMKVMENGKIRVFSNVDFVELYLTKKYLGFAVGQMQNHLFESSFTAGLDPMIQIFHLYRRLATHPNFLTFDYSGWDKRLPRQVQKIFLDNMLKVISQHYSEQEFKMARLCASMMLDRLEVFNGNLHRIKGSISSGIYWTNYLNSGANEVIIILSIMALFHQQHGRFPAIQEIMDNIVLFTHGDDVIMSVSNEWAEMINYFSLKRALEKMGMPITPGDKDGQERAFEPWEETTFLSRHPRRVRGYLFGALKKESILQQLNFSRNANDHDILKEIFQNVLEEACLWDAEFFDRVAANIKAKVKSLDMRMVVYSANTYLDKLMIRTGLLSGTSTPTQGTDDKQNNFPLEENCLGTLTKEHQARTMYKITCKVCAKEFDSYNDAHNHRVEHHEKDTLMTIRSEDNKALKESIMKGDGEFSTGQAVEQALSHKACVTACGKALLGKLFKEHDDSKLTVEELPGYALRWTYFLDGEIWEEALRHHYANNDHHPEFYKSLEDIGESAWEEMIVDAVACIWERQYKLRATPAEVLKVYRAQLDDSQHWGNKRYGKCIDVVKIVADNILERQITVEVSRNQLTCSECTMTTDSHVKMWRHLKNSHKKTLCFICNEEDDHIDNCPVVSVWKCPDCGVTNPIEKRLRNHIKSAHPKGKATPLYVPRKAEHQSGAAAAGISTDLSGLNVINQPNSGTSSTLANMPGIPKMAVVMPGNVTTMANNIHEWGYAETFSIADTALAGSSVFAKSYGNSYLNSAAMDAYGALHKYIYGAQEFRITIYGASNVSGSLIIGVMPAGTGTHTPTIDELMFYNNYVEISANGLLSGEVALNFTNTTMEPKVFGAALANAPTLHCLVKDQLSNKIGTGAVTVNLQVHTRMAPDAGFSYPIFPTIVRATGDQMDPCDAKRVVSISDFTDEGFTPYAYIDGVKAMTQVGQPHLVCNRKASTAPHISNFDRWTGQALYDVFSEFMVTQVGTIREGHGITTQGSGMEGVDVVQAYLASDPDYIANLLVNYENPSVEEVSATYHACGGGCAIQVATKSAVDQGFHHTLNQDARDTVVRSITAFDVRNTSRYTPLPTGVKRFTISANPIIGISATVETKYPIQGRSLSEQKLIDFLNKIGRGRSLKFNMTSSGVNIAELVFYYQTQTLAINSPLDYAYMTDEVQFSNFETVADSYIPNPQAANGSWINLITSTASAAENLDRMIKRDEMKRTGEHQATAAALMMGMAAMTTAESGLFAGSHQRQHQRWVEDMAPKVADFNKEMAELNHAYQVEMLKYGTASQMGVAAVNASLNYAADRAMLANRQDAVSELRAEQNANLASSQDSNLYGARSGDETRPKGGTAIPPTDELTTETQTWKEGNPDYDKASRMLDAGSGGSTEIATNPGVGRARAQPVPFESTAAVKPGVKVTTPYGAPNFVSGGTQQAGGTQATITQGGKTEVLEPTPVKTEPTAEVEGVTTDETKV